MESLPLGGPTSSPAMTYPRKLLIEAPETELESGYTFPGTRFLQHALALDPGGDEHGANVICPEDFRELVGTGLLSPR
jgi:hypothetical protein